jgi:alginate O-acetyltransferase complex protein AlgI
MVFSSAVFLLIFLPLCIIGHFIIPKKCRNLFLLLASLAFYTWGNYKYIWLLLLSILINYAVALLIAVSGRSTGTEDARSGAKGGMKASLALGIMLNLGLLFYFKYFTFAITSMDRFLGTDITIPDIILPIGISFFTFQGMSYIIDVYRGQVTANKNLLDIALYISLFPSLIAGPIVKYHDISEQIRSRTITTVSFASGIDRFIIGLAKKLLIADVLGGVAADIYGGLGIGIDAPSAWLAALCYMLQIYFDFSGYSDMAIGLCRMFGFELKENFNYPYISTSITEFWRRWHISLSTWFKEYLYIPLGGNRKGNVYLHLFIVFCATGIWHGAAWQFLLWGLWHGIFIIIERVLSKHDWWTKIPKWVKWCYAMLIVYFGWILFSANGFHAAIDVVQTMFGLQVAEYVQLSILFYLGNHKLIFTLIVALLAATPVLKQVSSNIVNTGSGRVIALLTCKRIILLALLLLCIFSAVSGTYSPFIYFRF